MSRSTFKILFYVKKGSERANGYLPLMCRLTVDGEIKQFSCKLDVPPKLWDVKTARATGKSVEAQKINAAVDRIRVDVNRRYQELMQSDGYVTAARLRDVYLGLGVKRETLLKLFEQHNLDGLKAGMEWAGITIVVFFVMLRATFSALSLTMKLPNPRKNTSSPAIIVSFMFLINASTTASAAVFSTPV